MRIEEIEIKLTRVNEYGRTFFDAQFLVKREHSGATEWMSLDELNDALATPEATDAE